LLRSPPENALCEWVVLSRVNKAGVGDGAPALVEKVA
jgi:hypothetical protein